MEPSAARHVLNTATILAAWVFLGLAYHFKWEMDPMVLAGTVAFLTGLGAPSLGRLLEDKMKKAGAQ